MFRKGGNSSCFLINQTRKIHTTFPDGSELVEEYDEGTQRITLRKRRRPTATGAATEWEVMLGDTQPSKAAAAAAGASGLMLHENSSNPRCVRMDTPGCFTWTISNLHYPADTFSVCLDAEGTAVIVSTTNKKYYRKLDMPEMKLLKLAGDSARLSWSHQGSTLMVNFFKPPVLLAEELADAKGAAAMRAQEAPADCRQQ